jgi:hypothetical protein
MIVICFPCILRETDNVVRATRMNLIGIWKKT